MELLKAYNQHCIVGEPFTQEEMEEMMSASVDPDQGVVLYKDYIHMMVVEDSQFNHVLEYETKLAVLGTAWSLMQINPENIKLSLLKISKTRQLWLL